MPPTKNSPHAEKPPTKISPLVNHLLHETKGKRPNCTPHDE